MKRLEIKMYIDIDETDTNFKDVENALSDDLEYIGKVVRVDLIDEIDI